MPALIAHGRHRATPYLYSDAEIRALVQAAERLRTRVYATTYPVLISLLAVAGMRFGEAVALDVNDFDPQHAGACQVVGSGAETVVSASLMRAGFVGVAERTRLGRTSAVSGI
ncbi:hypothetical protein GCM10010532_024860 [Dactylosporangium siamense]|uniref:Tyr recombinase domain-containing protein n=1 Tax=Dactylosporangium siamense TaxID=685454 RepID=A0A919PVR2_9ACTN|nr:hypothetical protein Dsi01nite_091800 [Dactylosporangium siamense]